MRINRREIQDLVDRRTERLNVVIMGWINPAKKEHYAKIIKTALALRSHSGGVLLIGFHDKILEPDTANAPNALAEVFHMDKITTSYHEVCL